MAKGNPDGLSALRFIKNYADRKKASRVTVLTDDEQDELRENSKNKARKDMEEEHEHDAKESNEAV